MKVSPSKLKRIFYDGDALPTKNSIYSNYDGQRVDAIIPDDTKSKRRSGGRPGVKGVIGLNLESGEKYLLHLGLIQSWPEVFAQIKKDFNLPDERYAICDGDPKLQMHLENAGYKIQQCTNHFVKTTNYYLWEEKYVKEDRMRIKKEISRIISTLKNSVKKHRKDHDFVRLEWRINKTQEELLSITNDLLSKDKESTTAKFILRTKDKVTLFAELVKKGIQIPDTNNHIENLMGIVGHRIKKNHQSWVDENLNIMLDTIWHILS
jgi:hypothetical protein